MNYIFRNYTIENFFGKEYVFSGYGDVTIHSQLYQNYFIFYQLNPSSLPEDQVNEIEDIRAKLSFIIDKVESRTLIFTLYHERGKDWQTKNPELSKAIGAFNNDLFTLAEQDKKVKIIDINIFLQDVQVPVTDWKYFFSSQVVLNPKLAKPFKSWLNAQVRSLDLKRKKCIVLDCDNTLWGGVVGEDGTHGIKLGMDYPGICFSSFQKHLQMLSRKGIILAICSKNNLKDVEDVWKNNPNQILTDKTVSAYRINWQDKASNIKSIAEELNIGLDSFVFIDDNPVERGLVKQFLPEVEVPEFPEKPYELLDFFWKIYHEYFDAYELSEEDLKKTEQYKENFFRNESKKAFGDMDSYLASLDIEIDVNEVHEGNLLRIAQMTQKTNQFNLTTKRYTEDDLRALITNGAKIYGANVKDKFGDNGITIACIVKDHPEFLEVDSYLLSCRILGRDIEKVTLLKIIYNINQYSDKPVKASFIPTRKNMMASEFLDQVGFKLDEVTEEGVKHYILDNNEEQIEIKPYYKINFI
jgi:FkbH-like protein